MHLVVDMDSLAGQLMRLSELICAHRPADQAANLQSQWQSIAKEKEGEAQRRAPAGRELVGGQRRGAGREGDSDDDAALAIPRLVRLQHLCVRRHVLQQETVSR